MSDIFISHASEDEKFARKLAAALEAEGWSTWWDRKIPPGKNWRNYIGPQLKEATCVIVLWSAKSVKSRWVLVEAEHALSRDAMIPVFLEKVSAPLGFGEMQAAKLSGWDGDRSGEAFRRLVQGISLVASAPAAKEEEATEAQPRVSLPFGLSPQLTGIIGLVLLVIGYLAFDRFSGTPVESLGQELDVRSIAVLPFVNMTGDADQEYFSDGISEELLNALAQVSDLRVVARTSAFQFKGENRDISDIARQLGVAFVLEGSVRRSGNRVRITAQLIDAKEGFHIWSDTYDRNMTDIFAIQDEISAAIVEEIAGRLNFELKSAPQVIVAASTEAYEAYLLGIHQMEKRGGGPLALAAEQFEKALQIDPDYVPAMARLAITYNLLPLYDFANNPSAEMRAKALPLVEKALALAPDLPEAQAAMGLHLWNDYDDLAAESFLRRALELNPSYATVQSWLADINNESERYDAALEMGEQAVRIDPLSRVALFNLINAYRSHKMTAKALPLLERLRSLDPYSHGIHLADMLKDEGRVAEAALAWLELLVLDKDDNRARGGFGSLLENQVGLYEEAIRFGWRPFTSLFATGKAEAAVSFVAALDPLVSPDDARFRALSGAILLVAGDTVKAREYLERAWEMVPDRPGKVRSYGGNQIMAMIASRQDAGDAAGAKELIDLRLAYLDGREAANKTVESELWYRGLLLLYSDQEKEGLAFMRRGIEASYGPDFVDYYVMERFADLDFAPVMELFEARKVRERDKFLKAVCNDGNPAPEVWSPLPATCEGYVGD